jgi:hypothetical protein
VGAAATSPIVLSDITIFNRVDSKDGHTHLIRAS